MAARTISTPSTTRAMSGRYIRRCAPTSVTIGTTLEAGASVTKNQVARKASGGRHRHRASAPVASTTSNASDGHTAARVAGSVTP